MKNVNQEFITLGFLVLSNISSIARMIVNKNQLKIYSVNRLELAAAILSLTGHFNMQLEGLIKISYLSTIIKKLDDIEISITDKIAIKGRNKNINDETQIELIPFSGEYPPLPRIDNLWYNYFIIHSKYLKEIFSMMPGSITDEIEIIVEKERNKAEFIGESNNVIVKASVPIIEKQINSPIRFRIPGHYSKLVKLLSQLDVPIIVSNQPDMPAIFTITEHYSNNNIIDIFDKLNTISVIIAARRHE